MTFPIFDLPLDPRTFSLTFQVEREREWIFLFLMIPHAAALSRDNYDIYAFRFFFSLSVFFLTSPCASVRGDHTRTNRISCPGCVQKSSTNACNASAILEDSLPPSDHFRYNRYRFEYRVDKLFCWHLRLREMSSRHPRDRRAKVVYQLPKLMQPELRRRDISNFTFLKDTNIILSC